MTAQKGLESFALASALPVSEARQWSVPSIRNKRAHQVRAERKKHAKLLASSKHGNCIENSTEFGFSHGTRIHSLPLPYRVDPDWVITLSLWALRRLSQLFFGILGDTLEEQQTMIVLPAQKSIRISSKLLHAYLILLAFWIETFTL